MINNELISYIKQQLALNVSREVISTNLKGSGWNDMDISEAFRVIMPISISTPVPVSPSVYGVTPNLNIAKTYTAQTDFSKPKHSKGKRILLFFLILILLGLAGGGAYAYYVGFFVSFPNLVSQSMDNARIIKTANYDVTVNVDFSEMESFISGLNSITSLGINSSQLGVTVKGSSDITDKNNFKNSSIISVNLGSLSLGAELRLLNSTLYAQVTQLPVLSILPIQSYSSYINKWFSFPYKSGDGQIVSNPFTRDAVNQNIAINLTDDQKEHVYEMFRDAHLIKQIARLNPDTIGGESSYHFTFDLDKDKISSYLQSLKAYINTVGKNDSKLSAFDPTTLSKELDKIKDFKGEIWIGRNDELIHKVSINFGVEPDPAKDEQAKVTMVAIFSDYNQPVSIIVPEDSTPFETIISGIISAPKILGNKDDLVSFSILPGSKLHGVVSYRGIIKGGYFFEANILINILDKNKKVLKASNAMATTDWMTAEPVSFEGNIDFSALPKGQGFFEIHNDNPSDMRQYDKSVLIPIVIE